MLKWGNGGSEVLYFENNHYIQVLVQILCTHTHTAVSLYSTWSVEMYLIKIKVSDNLHKMLKRVFSIIIIVFKVNN